MAAHANNTNRPHPLVAKPRQTTERLRNAGQHSARMATPKAESHAKGTTPAHAAKPHETATHAPSDTKAMRSPTVTSPNASRSVLPPSSHSSLPAMERDTPTSRATSCREPPSTAWMPPT